MKAPFGKWNKTPEGNADCFFQGAGEFLKSQLENKPNKKSAKKSKKYIERMYDIINGKYSKCPNSYVGS